MKLAGYTCLERLGHGTYGIVYKALEHATGKLVAVKRYKEITGDSGMDPVIMREIAILKSIPPHPNVIRALAIIYDTETKIIAMVMPLYEMDLRTYTERTGQQLLDTPRVKLFMYQLLLGLRHCHTYYIYHRDLKPGNILVDSAGHVTICDFSLSKSSTMVANNTPGIQTLWYRAPEVLLGNMRYSFGIDVWSLGCILGYLLRGGIDLFPGESEIHQLNLIFQLLGSPAPDDFAAEEGHVLPQWATCQKASWTTALPLVTDTDTLDLVSDLLDQMFKLNSKTRISARRALDHPFFNSIDKTVIPDGML